jgi:hypothetical protein
MFSKVLRQTHMYLGLFLAPWLLMYALSTIVMNHRAAFREHYGGSLVQWVKEKEETATFQFSAGAPAQFMAQQILERLGLSGNSNANLTKDGKRLTINRTDPVAPRRITYMPEENRLLVERQQFRVEPFLESLHRRRGYQSNFLLDDLWGFTVDLAIVGMLFWVASGLWMWWELKVTRRLGAVFALGGLAVFCLYLFSI